MRLFREVVPERELCLYLRLNRINNLRFLKSRINKRGTNYQFTPEYIKTGATLPSLDLIARKADSLVSNSTTITSIPALLSEE